MKLLALVFWSTFIFGQDVKITKNDPKTLFDDVIEIDSVKYKVMNLTDTPHYDLYRITDEVFVYKLFIWSDPNRKYTLIKECNN